MNKHLISHLERFCLSAFKVAENSTKNHPKIQLCFGSSWKLANQTDRQISSAVILSSRIAQHFQLKAKMVLNSAIAMLWSLGSQLSDCVYVIDLE